MLTPDEAAVVAGVGLPGIYGLLEAGRLHFTKTSEGLVLVCLNSLGRLVGE
jgi:excisionase family DNA binding protein